MIGNRRPARMPAWEAEFHLAITGSRCGESGLDAVALPVEGLLDLPAIILVIVQVGTVERIILIML